MCGSLGLSQAPSFPAALSQWCFLPLTCTCQEDLGPPLLLGRSRGSSSQLAPSAVTLQASSHSVASASGRPPSKPASGGVTTGWRHPWVPRWKLCRAQAVCPLCPVPRTEQGGGLGPQAAQGGRGKWWQQGEHHVWVK